MAGTAVLAQNGPVRGQVKLQKADGSTVPAADVLVEAFRTDIDKGKQPDAKTNKRGEFTFVAFPLGQRFVLSVSGPGIRPQIEPNVKANMENIVITVEEGDGRRPTEAEVREALKSAASGGMTEAERQALAKKNAEITATNEKIKAGDETARRSNLEGKAALDAKNWDLAIAKFNEGIAAVPDYVGSTPVLIAGKMLALKGRGYDLYLQGVRNTDLPVRTEKYSAAKKEYAEALTAYAQAMDVIKKAPAATDPKDQAVRKSLMFELHAIVIEIHRLMAVSQVDTTRTAEAETLIKEYIETETEPAKKTKALTTLGDIMRAATEFDKAAAAYKTVLETAPDNSEVMASLGLTLVAQGFASTPQNRDQLQEGLNYMQKYADTVAILPTDPPTVQEFKKSVKETVDYLKNEEKLKAQPTKAAPPRKRG